MGISGSGKSTIGKSLADRFSIPFLDADDLLLKDKIELQINALRESKAEVSYTLWGSFCNGSDIKECKIEHNYLLLQSGKDIMKSFGIDRWYVPLNSWLIKRRVIQRAGYWNTSITTNDDGEYLSRVLYWTTRVICVNSIQCLFRIHKGTSLSLIDTKSKAESALKSWILIKDLMKTYPDSKQMLSYPLKGLYIIFIETYILYILYI